MNKLWGGIYGGMGAIIIGFVLSIITGRFICGDHPLWGGILGLLVAGMVVGYMVGGDAANGMINGAVSVLLEV